MEFYICKIMSVLRNFFNAGEFGISDVPRLSTYLVVLLLKIMFVERTNSAVSILKFVGFCFSVVA